MGRSQQWGVVPLYKGYFLRGSGSRVGCTVTLQHGFLDRNFRSCFLQLLLKHLHLGLQFVDSRLLLDAQAVNLGCDDGALLRLSGMRTELQVDVVERTWAADSISDNAASAADAADVWLITEFARGVLSPSAAA